jgi:hypothetical protein
MTPVRIFFVTAALGLALSLLIGLLGFLIGGLFLFAMIPLFGRGRWAAVAGSLLGFGAGWTLLVALQLGRAGASGNDPLWLAVGFVPLVLGLTVTALLVALGRPTGPDGRGGRGGDALP